MRRTVPVRARLAETMVEMIHDHFEIHNYWWACKEPERPVDKATAYLSICEKCRLKAAVDLKNGGDISVNYGSKMVLLSELVNGTLV